MKSKTVQSEAPPAVAVQRVVSVRLDKTNSLGAWEIICDDCPLKPHLEALGMKAKACSAGIQTNVQGAVPLAQCEHYEKDSIKSEGKKLTLMCRKHANIRINHRIGWDIGNPWWEVNFAFLLGKKNLTKSSNGY